MAAELGFDQIEWTLDHVGLMNNPLMSREGRADMRRLTRRSKIRVTSVTMDNAMQAPFHKTKGALQHGLLEDFSAVVDACAAAKIKTLVFPLVDDGALENAQDEAALKMGLDIVFPVLARHQMRIAFESDFHPDRLAKFLSTYGTENFGLTYDIGNSAGLGFDPSEEFKAYGERIIHVHVKDRSKGGSTVPLGEGNARFDMVFDRLAAHDYHGDIILQTARADDDNHGGILATYRDMVLGWIEDRQRAESEAVH